ncbi:MAG TPA: glycosyltransferase family 2 protein [Microvirga sp.]|nr:glycosyltransferase family 2 protein [Microvirga sp.]
MSATHLVLIPSYNAGPKLFETVRDARRAWTPVWVVVDGSTDDSLAVLRRMAAADPGLTVMSLDVNRGKGAAVLHGIEAAQARGFTHVLTMDADGQHPADFVGPFMEASKKQPESVILGKPVFDETAPSIRLRGRRIANWWTDRETGKGTIGDSLFGFRVYPIADLIAVMRGSRWMRRFDFDPEAAVRLVWRGLPVVNIPAPCRYFGPEQGGVSHFNYLRDNVLLVAMHVRLVLAAIGRGLAVVRARR